MSIIYEDVHDYKMAVRTRWEGEGPEGWEEILDKAVVAMSKAARCAAESGERHEWIDAITNEVVLIIHPTGEIEFMPQGTPFHRLVPSAGVNCALS